MIPERKDEAKFARSVFFEGFNDVDVYVEDTAAGYEKIFVEILSRVFGEAVRIASVFPIGPRDKVLKRCAEMQGAFTRPSLFIVDGDLYLLNGDNVEPMSGLYVLPVYCLENILADPNAFHSIMNEEDPLVLRETLIAKFDFVNWLGHNEALLYNLFVEYATAFSVCPAIQTVKFPITGLVSGGEGMLDATKVAERIARLREECQKVIAKEEYDRVREIIKNRSVESPAKLRFASGKDYVLPLLKTRMKSLVKTRIPDINLKLRLAMRCNIDGLTDAKHRVALPT